MTRLDGTSRRSRMAQRCTITRRFFSPWTSGLPFAKTRRRHGIAANGGGEARTLMGRVIVGLAHACGLLLVLAVSVAEPACTGSELTVKARGGIGALSVTWRLTPPCDVAETGILLGRDLSTLTRVGAAIRRVESSYSSTIPVEQP